MTCGLTMAPRGRSRKKTQMLKEYPMWPSRRLQALGAKSSEPQTPSSIASEEGLVQQLVQGLPLVPPRSHVHLQQLENTRGEGNATKDDGMKKIHKLSLKC